MCLGEGWRGVQGGILVLLLVAEIQAPMPSGVHTHPRGLSSQDRSFQRTWVLGARHASSEVICPMWG